MLYSLFSCAFLALVTSALYLIFYLVLFFVSPIKVAAGAAEIARATELRLAREAGQHSTPAQDAAAATARRLRRQRRRLPQPLGSVTVSVACSERGDGSEGEELQQVRANNLNGSRRKQGAEQEFNKDSCDEVATESTFSALSCHMFICAKYAVNFVYD